MVSESSSKRLSSATTWTRRLCAPLLGLTSLSGAAHADLAAWHGPWHGQDLYVQVVTRGHTLGSGGNWWQWGNTRTDAYLFGFGKPGVDLIVDFSVQNRRVGAAIRLVPQSQRAGVTTSATGYQGPTTPPDATLTPVSGNWVNEGVPNFNLSGTVLSPVPSVLHVGSERPGQPTWATTLASGPVNKAVSEPQFGAAVQEDQSVPYELAEPLIPGFPYLSAGTEDQFYGPNKPLFYAADKRELQTRFVGFQTAGIYAVNSYAKPPELAFEAPFAWYRFDPAAGRFPNMMVRVEQFPAGYLNAPVPEVQRTATRMSWTGADYRKWRYSVSVVGDHALHDQVKIGDVTAWSVPYGSLAPWIAGQTWKGASFVEATTGFSGSEGIYSYSVEANPELFRWINGATQAPPTTFESPYLSGLSVVSPYYLPEDFRGEYSLIYNRQPTLYLSGTDRRVHLTGAQAGLWNLGSGQILRTADLNQDGHVDRWQLERVPLTPATSQPTQVGKGQVEQSLYALQGIQIVSDAAGVVVSQAPVLLDAALPLPTDAARWREFLNGMLPGQEQDPRHLRSWLSLLPGTVATVPHAVVSDLRPIEGGFRMILTARTTLAAMTSEAIRTDLSLGTALAAAQTGRHVLIYTAGSGRWSVQTAGTAAVQGQVRSPTLHSFTPTTLTVTLQNAGSLDQSGPATLLVNGKAVHHWTDLVVPAGGSINRKVRWTPDQALTNAFTVKWAGSQVAAGVLKVNPQDRLGGLSVFDLSAPLGGHGLVELLFISAAAITGLWLVWRKAL